MNKETLLIKELETSDSFPELLELSKDFFEIDSIDEVDIRNYFQKFIGNENVKAYIVIIEEEITGYITLVIKNADLSNYIQHYVGESNRIFKNKLDFA
jgi:hypothetical protein